MIEGERRRALGRSMLTWLAEHEATPLVAETDVDAVRVLPVAAGSRSSALWIRDNRTPSGTDACWFGAETVEALETSRSQCPMRYTIARGSERQSRAGRSAPW